MVDGIGGASRRPVPPQAAGVEGSREQQNAARTEPRSTEKAARDGLAAPSQDQVVRADSSKVGATPISIPRPIDPNQGPPAPVKPGHPSGEVCQVPTGGASPSAQAGDLRRPEPGTARKPEEQGASPGPLSEQGREGRAERRSESDRIGPEHGAPRPTRDTLHSPLAHPDLREPRRPAGDPNGLPHPSVRNEPRDLPKPEESRSAAQAAAPHEAARSASPQEAARSAVPHEATRSSASPGAAHENTHGPAVGPEGHPASGIPHPGLPPDPESGRTADRADRSEQARADAGGKPPPDMNAAPPHPGS